MSSVKRNTCKKIEAILAGMNIRGVAMVTGENKEYVVTIVYRDGKPDNYLGGLGDKIRSLGLADEDWEIREG